MFSSFYVILCLALSGTNGESASCQLFLQVLYKQNSDVRLAGTIGCPIFSFARFGGVLIFVVGASSFRLGCGGLFYSIYAAVLYFSPARLGRPGALSCCVSADFRLFSLRAQNSVVFFNRFDQYLPHRLPNLQFPRTLFKVATKLHQKFITIFHNEYFLSASHIEILSFVIELAKNFNVKKSNLIRAVKKFKGLHYRQQLLKELKKFQFPTIPNYGVIHLQ
jgi:UDP-N-acetylmuramoylalanine-D-glutamate ligase